MEHCNGYFSEILISSGTFLFLLVRVRYTWYEICMYFTILVFIVGASVYPGVLIDVDPCSRSGHATCYLTKHTQQRGPFIFPIINPCRDGFIKSLDAASPHPFIFEDSDLSSLIASAFVTPFLLRLELGASPKTVL